MLNTTGSVRLVTDPETKVFGQDKSVTEFVVASNRYDSRAKDKKAADFISVKVWGQRGLALADNFKKGDGLVISGSLQIEVWDGEDGQKNKKAVIVVNDWEFPVAKKSEARARVASGVSKSGEEAPF